MKAYVGLFFIAYVALVQGRSAVAPSTAARTPAVAGQVPYIVHLRIVQPDGQLRSCAGALIDERWVATAAACIENARFIWVRYGTLLVANPELVTETSQVRLSTDLDIGLVNINRNVHETDNIKVVALQTDNNADINANATVDLCSYGIGENGAADQLTCANLTLVAEQDSRNFWGLGSTVCTADLGTPLVLDSKLVGVLTYQADPCDVVSVEHTAGFSRVAPAVQWIASETGVDFEEEVEPSHIVNTVQVASL